MSSVKYIPRFISKAKRGRNYISKSMRDEVYTRDEYICQYCKRKYSRDKLSIEHIIPVSKGGIDDIINYITVCRSCNSSKKDKPLLEYINSHWDIKISELPIHGDVIMDTPELDKAYREARKDAYYLLRATEGLKGSNALKKLEKIFRSNLWKTNYGVVLSKRFPEIPGHERVSIPLVEYILPDTRIPAFKLLMEFCKSANTRAIIDDIVRICSNSSISSSIPVIKSVVYASEFDEATNKRIDQAFKRAKLRRGDSSIFNVPDSLQEVPVCPYDLLEITIEKEEENYGLAFIDGYVIKIANVQMGQKIEVVIKNVNQNFALAELAYLPNDFAKE